MATPPVGKRFVSDDFSIGNGEVRGRPRDARVNQVRSRSLPSGRAEIRPTFEGRTISRNPPAVFAIEKKLNDFTFAIANVHDEEVNALIQSFSPEELITKNQEGKTAFNIALSKGCDCCRAGFLVAMAEKLFSKPEIVPDPIKLDLLHQMIERGYEKVAFLIAPHLRHISDQAKLSLLRKAIQHEKIDLALVGINEMSIESLSSADENGQTVIDLAMDTCSLKTLRALQGKLPREIFQDRHRNRIIELCSSTGSAEAFSLTLEKLFPKGEPIPDEVGHFALWIAIQKGWTDCALLLVERLSPEQLSMPHKNENGLGALHWAIHCKQERVALALVDKLFPEHLCRQGKQGQLALDWAMDEEMEEVALAMIQKQSPEQLSIPDKRTNIPPLNWALRGRSKKIALAMIEKSSPKQLSAQYPIKDFFDLMRFEPEITLAFLEKYPAEDLSMRKLDSYEFCEKLMSHWTARYKAVLLAFIKKLPIEELFLPHFHNYPSVLHYLLDHLKNKRRLAEPTAALLLAMVDRLPSQHLLNEKLKLQEKLLAFADCCLTESREVLKQMIESKRKSV